MTKIRGTSLHYDNLSAYIGAETLDFLKAKTFSVRDPPDLAPSYFRRFLKSKSNCGDYASNLEALGSLEMAFGTSHQTASNDALRGGFTVWARALIMPWNTMKKYIIIKPQTNYFVTKFFNMIFGAAICTFKVCRPPLDWGSLAHSSRMASYVTVETSAWMLSCPVHIRSVYHCKIRSDLGDPEVSWPSSWASPPMWSIRLARGSSFPVFVRQIFRCGQKGVIDFYGWWLSALSRYMMAHSLPRAAPFGTGRQRSMLTLSCA